MPSQRTAWWPQIAIAVIGVIGSLGSSYIQTQKVATEKAEEVAAGNIIPIGTIVGSVLPPEEFYRQAKLLPTFDPEKYTWVHADGRDVTRSAYERLPGRKSSVPDLRGLFLRGINRGATKEYGDPDGERSPGNVQPDAFAQHDHIATLPNIAATSDALGFGAMAQKSVGASGSSPVVVQKAGGAETRPKNAAVFWYIRIN